MKRTKVSLSDALSIIHEKKLTTPANSWNYAYNIAAFYDHMYVSEHENIIVVHNTRVNQYCPPPVYTNTSNLFSYAKDLGMDTTARNYGYRNIFYYLKISSFFDFLVKCSSATKKAYKRFPTTKTYEKYKKSKYYNCETQLQDLDEDRFCRIYDKYKGESGYAHTGKQAVQALIRNTRSCSHLSKKMYVLAKDGVDIGSCLLVWDEANKSVSLENLASIEDSQSYGIFMITELISSLSHHGMQHFDAYCGEEGHQYKSKLFHDKYTCFDIL